MILIISFSIFTILYVLFKFFYIPFSKKNELKKNKIKEKEDLLKHHLMNCNPEFIDMCNEFNHDQKEKIKSGYHSDLMISEGGYMTNIYGKYIYVYDQYFENCFYKKLETKYNEIKNNPIELEKYQI